MFLIQISTTTNSWDKIYKYWPSKLLFLNFHIWQIPPKKQHLKAEKIVDDTITLLKLSSRTEKPKLRNACVRLPSSLCLLLQPQNLVAHTVPQYYTFPNTVLFVLTKRRIRVNKLKSTFVMKGQNQSQRAASLYWLISGISCSVVWIKVPKSVCAFLKYSTQEPEDVSAASEIGSEPLRQGRRACS